MRNRIGSRPRIALAAVLVILGAVSVYAGGAREKDAMSSGGAMKAQDAMEPEDAMKSDDKMEPEGSMKADDAMSADAAMGMGLRNAPSAGMKVQFTDLAAAQAQASKGPTVLFFAADWCPDCQAALKDINANGAALGDITVVVVDYDKERDLKAKYGITYQHTFVQIDAMGAALVKWSGGGVDEIVSHVSSKAAM